MPMVHHLSRLILLTGLAGHGATFVAAQEEGGAGQLPDSGVRIEPTTEPHDPKDLPRLSIELSHRPYPEGIGDEAAYLKWLGVRASELERQVVEEPATPADVEANLECASFMLMRGIEPGLTWRLLSGSSTADESLLHVMTALGALGSADSALEMLKDVGAADLNADRLAELKKDHIALTAFAMAGEALLRTSENLDDLLFNKSYLIVALSDPTEALEALRRAASDLAIATEDGSPEIIAASRLWQSLLLERAGLRDRVMTLLPLALTPPAPNAILWDYFARLQRCRLLYTGKEKPSQEGYAAAWALLLQLEDTAFEWFKDEGQRQEAVRTAAWFRYGLLGQWRQARGDQAGAAEREWFQKAEQRLREQYFTGDEPHTVLRLESAIPMLIESKPDAKSKLPAQAAPMKPNDTGVSNAPH